MARTDNRRLLLDTHVFVWLMNGDPRLSNTTVQRRIEAAARDTELLLSVVSVWEIGRWVRTGLLRTPLPAADWVSRALDTPGLVVAPLDPAVAVEAGALPGSPPADFADQVIVATARYRDALLVTADTGMREYAAGGYLRVEAV